jgi:heme oxygenase
MTERGAVATGGRLDEAPRAVARLRTETRDLHTLTEGTGLARAMVRGAMSRRQYVTQLAAYLRIHTALDAALESRAVRGLGAGERARQLSHDLASLAHIEPAHPPSLDAALTDLEARIASEERAAVLGRLYVMEGSSLGAAILFPRLKASLQLEDDAMTYYRGHGADTIPKWRVFSDRLNEALAKGGADEAIAAARDMFARIATIFDAVWVAEAPAVTPIMRTKPPLEIVGRDSHVRG